MGKSSAPSAPNPYTSAAAQYQYGTEAANYNMGLNAVNQVGPTGSTTWSVNPSGVPTSGASSSPTSQAPGQVGSPVNTARGYTPGTTSTGASATEGAPQYTETTTLSPAEQAILSGQQSQQIGAAGLTDNALSAAQSAVGQALPTLPAAQYTPTGYAQTQTQLNTSGLAPVNQSLSTSNVPGIIGQNGPGGLEQAYNQATNTALQGNMAAISPALNAQYEQLDASLRNSGNLPGSPAYNQAMSQFMAGAGNEETQAAGAAENTGINLENSLYGQSANTNSQLYGQDLNTFNANNAAQQQLFGQDLNTMSANNTAAAQTYNESNQNLQDLMSNRTAALGQYGDEQSIPLSTLGSLESLTNPSIPSSSSSPSASVSAPDIMSAFQNQYQGQLNAYNASVGQSNSLLGDIGSLGALAILAA